ncbi:hypothetical protein NXV87_00730 [Bacteroides fragilis]|nr:hypothetical protein [Bacteroides fragilis]
MNWGIHDRRGWMVVILLLCAYPFSAQNAGQITLELRDKPLPAVLKLIEKAGEKHIIFSYNETETYHVTASIHQKTNRKHFPSFWKVPRSSIKNEKTILSFRKQG